MPIANITYGTIVNQVKNWIKSNCKNISNYGGINAVFKKGWSKSESTINAPGYQGTCTIAITSYVPQASGTNVDNDMASFCNTYNISNKLNTYVSEDEFYHFIQNMISFLCTKCVLTCSQFAQGTSYLVYDPTNTTFNTTFNITSNEQQRLIYSLDVTSLMATMVDVVNNNIRCEPCKYSWSLSA